MMTVVLCWRLSLWHFHWLSIIVISSLSVPAPVPNWSIPKRMLRLNCAALPLTIQSTTYWAADRTFRRSSMTMNHHYHRARTDNYRLQSLRALTWVRGRRRKNLKINNFSNRFPPLLNGIKLCPPSGVHSCYRFPWVSSNIETFGARHTHCTIIATHTIQIAIESSNTATAASASHIWHRHPTTDAWIEFLDCKR